MTRFLYFFPLLLYYLIQILSAAFMPPAYAAVLTAVVCTLGFIPVWQKLDNAASHPSFPPSRLILCACAGAVFSCVSYILMLHLGMYTRFSNETQEALFSLPPLLQITGLCLFVPICEELVYRGFLLRGLHSFLPAAMAAVAEIIMFSVGHGNIIQMIYALPAAVILTLLCEKYSLGAAVSFHIGANLCSVLAGLLHLFPAV